MSKRWYSTDVDVATLKSCCFALDVFLSVFHFLIQTNTVVICTGECKKTNPGAEYRGTVSKTISGLTCQDWKSQSPHKHNNTPQDSPKAGLFKNYCRNPDNKAKGPWCYTTSKEKVYEHCDVKLCKYIF